MNIRPQSNPKCECRQASKHRPCIRVAASHWAHGHQQPIAAQQHPALNHPEVDRRKALLSGIALSSAWSLEATASSATALTALALPHAAGAAERDLLSEAAQEGTPFVLPALSPPQYIDRIVNARPLAWERLRDLLDSGSYKKVSGMPAYPLPSNVHRLTAIVSLSSPAISNPSHL